VKPEKPIAISSPQELEELQDLFYAGKAVKDLSF